MTFPCTPSVLVSYSSMCDGLPATSRCVDFLVENVIRGRTWCNSGQWHGVGASAVCPINTPRVGFPTPTCSSRPAVLLLYFALRLSNADGVKVLNNTTEAWSSSHW